MKQEQEQKFRVTLRSPFRYPKKGGEPIVKDEKKGTIGVFHIRGKFQFSHENPEFEVTRDDLKVFTRRKNLETALQKVAYEFDPLYVIHGIDESTKAQILRECEAEFKEYARAKKEELGLA